MHTNLPPALGTFQFVERYVAPGAITSSKSFAVPSGARRIRLDYRIKQAAAIQVYVRYNGVRTSSQSLQTRVADGGVVASGRDANGLKIAAGDPATTIQSDGYAELTVDVGFIRRFRSEGSSFDTAVPVTGRATNQVWISEGHIDDAATVISTVDLWSNGGANILAGTEIDFSVAY